MDFCHVAGLLLCFFVTFVVAKPQLHLRHSQVSAGGDLRSKNYQAPSEGQAGCSKSFAFR